MDRDPNECLKIRQKAGGQGPFLFTLIIFSNMKVMNSTPYYVWLNIDNEIVAKWPRH